MSVKLQPSMLNISVDLDKLKEKVDIKELESDTDTTTSHTSTTESSSVTVDKPSPMLQQELRESLRELNAVKELKRTTLPNSKQMHRADIMRSLKAQTRIADIKHLNGNRSISYTYSDVPREEDPVTVREVKNTVRKIRSVNTTNYKNWDVSDTKMWLETIGLEENVEIFEEHEIIGCILHDITENHLKEMNITKIGYRLRILQEIKKLKFDDN